MKSTWMTALALVAAALCGSRATAQSCPTCTPSYAQPGYATAGAPPQSYAPQNYAPANCATGQCGGGCAAGQCGGGCATGQCGGGCMTGGCGGGGCNGQDCGWGLGIGTRKWSGGTIGKLGLHNCANVDLLGQPCNKCSCCKPLGDTCCPPKDGIIVRAYCALCCKNCPLDAPSLKKKDYPLGFPQSPYVRSPRDYFMVDIHAQNY